MSTDKQTMLDTLSPQKRTALIQALRDRALSDRIAVISVRGSGNEAPLSAAQRSLWTLEQLESAQGVTHRAYHEVAAFRVDGALDVSVLERVLREIVARHEVLRTTFAAIDSEVVQQIAPAGLLDFEVVDLTTVPVSEQSAALADAVHRERALAFDLARGPLFRVALLHRSSAHSVLLIVAHHIILDGWSIGVFRKELTSLYDAFIAGNPSPLPGLAIQYADYAIWQHTDVQRHKHRAQLQYWKQQLAEVPPLLELSVARQRPEVPTHCGGRHYFRLPADLILQVKEMARRENATLFMTLLAAFQILLHRYSRQAVIPVGTAVANRAQPELEALIGYFLNSVVMRGDLSDDPTVTDFVRRTREVALAAYENQEVPFQSVVDALQPERSTQYHPLFQIAFNLQNTPKADVRGSSLRLSPEVIGELAAKFDLILWLEETDEGLRGYWEYSADTFGPRTLERMAGHLRVVLQGMVETPQLRISTLPILTAAERQQILGDWSRAQAIAEPPPVCIHELIEAQIEATPNATAIVYGGVEVSYREINNRANAWARQLVALNVVPGSLVGLYAGRSIEMTVALLAILKCGAAYVPMDPSYPRDRIEQILRDAQPAYVLVQHALVDQIASSNAQLLIMENLPDAASDDDGTNLAIRIDDSSAAYVIYTSGSTGAPKGVAITHRNLVCSTVARTHVYSMSPSCFLLLSSIAFDSSAAGIYWTLSCGGALVIPEEGRVHDVAYLTELVNGHRVSHLLAIPALYAELLDQQNMRRQPSALRTVIVAGDVCPPGLVRSHASRLPDVELHNEYGPTEATVWCTGHRCSAGDGDGVVPVGRPIPFSQAYVLDQYLQPVPAGVTGELFIGGAGVANGYLHRPELTAEKFLDVVMDGMGRTRLYRTGDLARWRDDGVIEVLGRTDQQVKIRGFRIELGEIEARLAQHELVREAAVIAREDGQGAKRLLAYVTCRAGGTASADELRAHVKAALPEHMIPSAFVVLDVLPSTPSGKLDRRSLPVPGPEAFARRQYEAPRGEMEEMLAATWQSLLDVERVGRQDNFFELGGHSMLIARMMNRLRSLGLSADIQRVFESRTLADLASAVMRPDTRQTGVPPNLIPIGRKAITPQMLTLIELEPQHIELIERSVPGGAANIQDIYPLMPLQEGVLFHHLLDREAGDTYIVTTALSISSRERLEAMIAALQAVVDRHDALRTSILWERLPQPVQVVHRHAPLSVQEIPWDRAIDPMKQIEQWASPESQQMDIRHAPMIRMQVAADSKAGQWYVLLQFHHIAIDHVTFDIVTSEVLAHMEERAQELPEPGPYRNHVALTLANARKQDVEAFFREKLAGIDEPTTPFGLTDVRGNGGRIEESRQELEPAMANRVRMQARNQGVSAATLFHAAWALVVAYTSGRDDVVFGSLMLGRLQGDADGKRVLGLFINTLPLRLQLQGVTTVEMVARTQREIAGLINHDQASLAVAQKCSGINGSLPLFSALLNYVHVLPNTEAQWSNAQGVRALMVQERTNYPITLSVEDSDAGFILTAQTDRRVDPRRLVGYLSTAIASLVEALETEPRKPALLLTVLPEFERRQLMGQFEAIACSEHRHNTIPQLFEAQASRTPDAVAVVHEGQSLTYQGLNRKANQLARYLRERGVEPDQLVGICVERGLEMVVGLLGILKAGAAYVPLDPDYPPERLAYMLEDAAPCALLIQEQLRERLSGATAEVISIDRSWDEIARQASNNLDAQASGLRPHHLAYVIYTSGSTGRPKGVMVEHRNVVRLFDATEQWFHFKEDDIWTQFHSFAFDFSVWELWGALLYGGRLVVVPYATTRSANEFYRLICEQGVTVLNQTPSAFAQLIDAQARNPEGRHALRVVVFGGEAVELRMLRPWVERNGAQRPQLVNMYGITETTVHVTYCPLTATEIDSEGSSPVGRPIPDMRVYLLNRHRQPVALGIAGEIYVGGGGVARGYLNRPELTAERFLSDPFGAGEGAPLHMYRSGDLGRWRANGTLEYLGRNDTQVKIRGFRIELGEIESALARHSKVKDAVVIAREDVRGDRRLVAYVVPRESSDAPGALSLRTQLRLALPEHMVPSAFVTLDSLPLTSNGKLDLAALPPPQSDAYINRSYESPQGELEETIAVVWQGVLGLNQVGREDNFFDIGGNSLLAMQVMARVQASLFIEIPIRLLFESPTLRSLAQRLSELRQSELLDTLAQGGADVDELLDRVASMSESHVQQLLREMITEARRKDNECNVGGDENAGHAIEGQGQTSRASSQEVKAFGRVKPLSACRRW